ncbi:hypothetical protein [Oceanobacter kriegii]|uniref:hypothetical protein n=1 Tax=Oceanobacter kriegii TaxID=64972 RepID=UPI0003F67487|nr:hypothetical protein [Oceanobacter kriegii]
MPTTPVSSSKATSVLKDKVANADHSDLKTSGFWISQMLMIAATIIGVYLAAQAGLEQAIAFDDITSKQSNYYLRRSLYQEVSSNVTMLRSYNKEYFSRAIPKSQLKQHTPTLRQFVWRAMENSPATLETPSYFLTEVQDFYAETDALIELGVARVYGASHAGKLMTEQLDHIENDVLPKLANDVNTLAVELREAGISIDEEDLGV